MKHCCHTNVIGCTNGVYIANCSLTFFRKSTEFIIGEATGNMVSSSAEPVVITAHLQGNLSTQQNSGVNQQSGFLKGNLVYPKFLPEDIYDHVADIEYTDPETGYSYKGKFFMQPLFKSGRPRVVQALASKFGSEIAGTFRWG